VKVFWWINCGFSVKCLLYCVCAIFSLSLSSNVFLLLIQPLSISLETTCESISSPFPIMGRVFSIAREITLCSLCLAMSFRGMNEV